MGSDKAKRMIVVMSCGHCPLSRLMRVKDGPYCNHKATDGMSVADYSDNMHPDCPLRDVADTPELLEKLEVADQLLTDAITGVDQQRERAERAEAQLKTANDILIIIKPAHDKMAKQNANLLVQLRYSRSICQIYLMYRKAYSLKMCGDCKICKVMTEIEKEG